MRLPRPSPLAPILCLVALSVLCFSAGAITLPVPLAAVGERLPVFAVWDSFARANSTGSIGTPHLGAAWAPKTDAWAASTNASLIGQRVVVRDAATSTYFGQTISSNLIMVEMSGRWEPLTGTGAPAELIIGVSAGAGNWHTNCVRARISPTVALLESISDTSTNHLAGVPLNYQGDLRDHSWVIFFDTTSGNLRLYQNGNLVVTHTAAAITTLGGDNLIVGIEYPEAEPSKTASLSAVRAWLDMGYQPGFIADPLNLAGLYQDLGLTPVGVQTLRQGATTTTTLEDESVSTNHLDSTLYGLVTEELTIADASIATNKIDATFHGLLVAGGVPTIADASLTTNKIDSTFHGLLTTRNFEGASLTINGASPAGAPVAIRGATAQSAQIFQVQQSNAAVVFGVGPLGAVTATSFAGQVGWSNLVDTTAAISTNMLDATAHGRLERTISWNDLADVPAGFADGTDATGSSTVTGAASVALVSSLSALTGSAGAIVWVANGFTAGDGGGAFWEWQNSGTTNVGLIYGGTSGHYWKLRPINNRVACTTLGMVGNASTDNAAKVLLATAFCQANKYVMTIPVGTYNFASKVTFPALTNSFIEGVSEKDSVWNWTSTTASEGLYSADAGGDLDWRNFTITGTGTNWALYLDARYENVRMQRVTMSSPGGGWYQRGALVNAHIIDCTIKDATNINKSAWYLIGDSTLGSGNVSSNINLIRPRMSNIAASGISLLNVKGALIDHLVSYNVGNLSPSTHQPHHIYLASGCEDVTIIAPDIYGQQDSTDYGSGIQLYSGITTEIRGGGASTNRVPTIKRTRIIGGRIEQTYDGLIVYGAMDTRVTGLTITNQISAGTSVAVGDDIYGLVLDGCSFYGNANVGTGLSVATSTTAVPNSYYDKFDVQVMGSTFAGYKTGAIKFGGTRFLASGNTIYQDVSGSASGIYSIMPYAVNTKNYYGSILGNVIFSNETGTYAVGGISVSTQAYMTVKGNAIWGGRGTGISGSAATTFIQGNSSTASTPYATSGTSTDGNL